MSLTLSYLSSTRRHLLSIMEAALKAVEPKAAILRTLKRQGNQLRIPSEPSFVFELGKFKRIFVIGAGKAAAPMAQAMEELLGEQLNGGLVIVKYDHLVPLSRIQLREAAHPLPDAAGLAAGEEILALAAQANKDDLVFCLLSGGGSALLESLSPPLTLNDLQATTSVLLASGATINEINTVRKHLSRLKGGQLAQAVAPATLITLVLSDVIGSPLDVIASGPTVPDASSWEDVALIVERYKLEFKLPIKVRQYLAAGIKADLPDTPKADNALFSKGKVIIVADNAQAAEAAQREAQALGYNSMILSTFLQGEAQEVGKIAVALGREVQAHQRPCSMPACLILGGETTVTFEKAGKGGRNQEVALAAALALAEQQAISIGTLATDGTDGPTDSAGAIVDSSSIARAKAQGFEPLKHLLTHDAYPLLDAIGDLLRSGPTKTNVNDLLFIIVEDRADEHQSAS